jgi:trans-2,3-dihydro-3-hydroxyanthranilate isomerase
VAAPAPSPFAYVLLDVFTDTPLQGNQLAVFTDARGVPEAKMQPLARELNLSESVFVFPPEQGGDARIRIFTPASELPFAGHPVLGTAIVLGRRLGKDEVTLETPGGHVLVRLSLGAEGDRVFSGWMSQPIPSWEEFGQREQLLAALGLERAGLPVEIYTNGPRHVYVELASVDAVASLRPNLGALERLGQIGVSCFAGSGTRWRTRVFAPGLGVGEDPATGSAAGPLAVHLARHGRIAFGDEVEIGQGAEIGRPSLLRARVDGSGDQIEQVQVGGSAVLVGHGEISLG